MYRSILLFGLLGVFGAAVADEKTAAPPPPAQAVAGDDEAAIAPSCPQDTGTRLRRQPGDCLSTPGRSYGSDELRATGAINVGDGLRRMDPSLTTGR